jgi:hypothetical protein
VERPAIGNGCDGRACHHSVVAEIVRRHRHAVLGNVLRSRTNDAPYLPDMHSPQR